MVSNPHLFATRPELANIRRRLNAHDWYARSFAHLRAPADELLRRGISIPREKGFVFYETCPDDSTPLRQDPFNPRDHICPTCGRNYTDEPYYRAWVTFFQSYLAQRALEMGIAYGVTDDSAYAAAIRHILLDYARHYEDYPLVDCVLGPTRLFESTYIESLWLANLGAAADFARNAIPRNEWRFLRDRLFLPSARVIADYDEGDNNRQAMNNVALGTVGLLFEESSLVDHAVRGPHGWLHHLEHSVLEDGLWYEGDNYHFATLAAMINLADAMTRNGSDLFQLEVGGRRLNMMFDAPLMDLYPDLTFPARKDARYGSPAGQHWYAGMYELAYRRYGDSAYARFLRTLYAHPPAAEEVLSNAAGLIDVLPSRPASRERLDWRGFLNAEPDLAAGSGIPVTRSLDMGGTGLAILRADGGRTYASLDYGHYGGGHGHPDRLQVNFYARGRRWLTDWGTGNYFLDHLRWYRSTIAHNTVAVDGTSQQAVDGRLLRLASDAAHPMAAASVEGAYHGVRSRRTIVLLSPDLLLDLFTIEADQERCLDWALHPWASPDVMLDGATGPLVPARLAGESYEWLHDVRGADASGDWVASFRQANDHFALHMLGQPGTTVYTAGAYGPPERIPELFPVLIARRHARRTTYAALLEHRAGGVPAVEAFRSVGDGVHAILLRDGGRIDCRHGADGDIVAVEEVNAEGKRIASSRYPAASPRHAVTRAETPDVSLDVDAWLPNLAGPTLRVHVAHQLAGMQEVTVATGAHTRTLQIQCEATVDLSLDGRRMEDALPLRVSAGSTTVELNPHRPIARLGQEYALDDASQVRPGERLWRGPEDLSAHFRLDLEDDALTLHVRVVDDTVVASGAVEHPYDYDSVQVYLDPRGDEDRKNAHLIGILGFVLVPATPDGEPARIIPIGPARSGTDGAAGSAASLEGLRLRSHLHADGYELEFSLPLDHLPRIPKPGDSVGFDLIVNDNDGTFRRAQQMIWTGAGGARIWLRQDYHPPQRYGVLVF